jgi:hypothetical protein
MDKRPRIDLDGVTLSDPDGPSAAVAIFRYRTVEGLVLGMPESTDVLVPWADVESSALELESAKLVVAFTEAYATSANWLGGVRRLEGRWMDRMTIHRQDVER